MEGDMPFAKKFRAMMDMPFAGDRIGEFDVESIDVRDEWGAPEGYAYSIHMVLRGLGGEQGVRRALKPMFSQHPTTFSGYGNPYQLWFHKPEIEGLGDRRYAVIARGAGARIFLEQDLDRFLDYLGEKGLLADRPDPAAREALIEAYLEQYRAEIKRLVDRYKRKLGKEQTNPAQADEASYG
jgi:hypothetical protein